VEPPQSLSAVQPRHACVATLQAGVVPPQVALVTQGTHVAVAASHAGVPPVHSVTFVVEQTPHDPFG
jgi:hypothetical protein